jgi:hypothetical protein
MSAGLIKNAFPGLHKINMDLLKLLLVGVVSRRGYYYGLAYDAGYDYQNQSDFYSRMGLCPVDPSGLVPEGAEGVVSDEQFFAMFYMAQSEGRRYTQEEKNVLSGYIKWKDLSRRANVLEAHMKPKAGSEAKGYSLESHAYHNGYLMGINPLSEDVLTAMLEKKIEAFSLSGVLYDKIAKDLHLEDRVKDNKGTILPIGARHESEVMDYLLNAGIVWGHNGVNLSDKLNEAGYSSLNAYLGGVEVAQDIRKALVSKANSIAEEKGYTLVGINGTSGYYVVSDEVPDVTICIGNGLFVKSKDDLGKEKTVKSLAIAEKDGPEIVKERKFSLSVYRTPDRGVLWWYDAYKGFSQEDKISISQQVEEDGRLSEKELRDLMLFNKFEEGYLVRTGGSLGETSGGGHAKKSRLSYLGNHANNIYGAGQVQVAGDSLPAQFLGALQGYSASVETTGDSYSDLLVLGYNEYVDMPQALPVQDAGDYIPKKGILGWLSNRLTSDVVKKLDKLGQDSLEGRILEAVNNYMEDGFSTYEVPSGTGYEEYMKALSKVFCIIAGVKEGYICQA